MIDIDKMNKLDEDGLFITNKHIFFYGSALSNFQITSFTYGAFGEYHRFFTSEQAFMWHKAMHFNDKVTATKILQENLDPMACKKLGRQVANYNEEEWDKVRYDVFYAVNLQKFTQDKKMKDFILQDKFEGKTFVEASPYDGIWGVRIPIGDPAIADENNWRGRNLLGKCLTEVRAAVKNTMATTNNSTVAKVHLTWKDIEDKVDRLADNIKTQSYISKFDAIVSIGRGGMIPARLLAEKLDIHTIYIVDAKAYNKDNKLEKIQVSDIKLDDSIKSILLVDDVIFTGTTISAVFDKITKSNPNLICVDNAFLYRNDRVKDCGLDYWYADRYDGNSEWLVFPWEND